jgi:hypothetical protein
MSLADTPSATAVLNDTTAEAIALVDTPSATASVGVSTDETITFADTPSVTTDWAVSTSEAIALADTPSAVTDFAVSASEVIALADTPSATAVYNVSVSESINLVDTSIGDSGNDATSAESISLTDTPSATASFVASVSESITFTDTCDAEVVPAGDITGDVETGQVQECDGTANITQRSRFGGGGTGELPEWHSVYEFIEATVSTGQSQSTVADAEVIEPPAITATIKTGSRPGATRARLSLIDPVELSISTGQGQWCSAGNIETEYEVEVTTGSANQSAATGEMDQWTEDEIAAVILLLAA